MINVYIDLDGVLFDFESKYFEYDKYFTKESFHRFINDGGFQKLEPLPNSKNLMEYLCKLSLKHSISLQILGSTGVSDRVMYNKVIHQKMNSLKTHYEKELQYIDKYNFVLNKGLKKHFATPNSILIDDTHQNIYDFDEHFGKGFYYEDVKSDVIISDIQLYIEEQTKYNYTIVKGMERIR